MRYTLFIIFIVMAEIFMHKFIKEIEQRENEKAFQSFCIVIIAFSGWTISFGEILGGI